MSNIKAPLTISNNNKRNFDKLIKIIPSIYYEINPKAKISIFGVNDNCVDIVSNLILNFIPVEIYVFDESQLNLDIRIMDFKYFKSINSNLSLHCGTDIKKTANSDICIVCFMMENQNENSFFLNLDAIIININLYKKYIPKIVKYSPNTILIVATYPFSIMTHYCLKFSKLSENRVLGIGTSIATCLFRKMLANYFNINSKDVYGWVSSFFTLNQSNLLISNPSLLWSTVMVGGVHIENLIDLSFKQNYDYLNHILKYNDKYTEAITNSSIVPIIGAVCYELCQCILTDSRIAISLSCNIKGYFGIQYSVYLGLPCIVGRSGYVEFVKMILSDRDIDKLKHGALCNYKVFKIIDQKLKENLKQAT